MSWLELFVIAVGLSMDAFAVSVCIGLSSKKRGMAEALRAGLYFGFFQAMMPVIGFLLSRSFADSITAFDHWIAFALLAFIGTKMIKESLEKDGDESEEGALSTRRMLTLAVATSIDALAVGISFAFLKVDILPASALIGAATFTLSFLGVKAGNIFGTKLKSKAEFCGGAVLVLMGAKILLEHLGIIAA